MKIDTPKLRSCLSSLGIIVIIGIAGMVGYQMGLSSVPPSAKISGVINQSSEDLKDADFGLFWDAWSELEKRYVGRGNLDKQEMVYGAISGMVSATGDPYTTFFKPESAKIFKEDVNGSFSGIGAEIGFRKGVLTIISPLENSPAEKAGLKTGDSILKVNGESTADMSLETAVAKIRGERGKEVALTVFGLDSEETKEVKITRDKIEIPTIKSEIKDGNVGYIKLYNFTGNSLELFDNSVNDLLKKGAQRFIVDLRGNPGGYLDYAIEMASMVVPKGDVIVSEDFGAGNGKERKDHRSVGYKTLEGVPMVVLVNEGSASASEIFAGAVKGKAHVQIVGTKSFGKGSVQELVELPNDTFLKVTIAKWLTPDGTSIQDNGITPDTEVEQGDDITKDAQLDKALNIIKTL